MKKGFTLIELLGVIVILGVISLLVVPTMNKLLKDAKQKTYDRQVLIIEESARKWGINHIDELNETTSTFVSVQDLMNEGLIEQDELIDPRDSKVMNGCTIIEYIPSKNKYKYDYINNNCAMVSDPNVLRPISPEYTCFTFDEKTETLTSYSGTCSKDVKVPQKIIKGDLVYNIRNISAGAFYNKQLTSLIIPEGVLEIGDGTYGAFRGNFITDLVIPSSMTKIGTYAFYDNNITNLDLSKATNLRTIGNFAFYLNNITNLDLSKATNLEVIDGYSFYSNDIATLNLSNLSKLYEIDSNAFYGNNITNLDLTSLTNLRYIWSNVFYSNNISTLNLTGLTNLGYIGSNAFRNNSISNVDLTSLTNLTNLSSGAFSTNNITSAKVGHRVSYIGDGPFSNNPNLETLTVDATNLTFKSVNNAIYTKDGTRLIQGTKGMSNNIEPTVTNIYDNSFEGMGLTSVTLPSSVTYISYEAFLNNAITSLDLSGLTNLYTISSYAFQNNNISSLNLTGLTNLRSIGTWAFRNNQLSSVTIPASVTSIGSYAFNQVSTYPWSSVTIEYDASNPLTRFNSSWTSIGWPSNLMP